MGMSFSNLHIRRREDLVVDDLRVCLEEIMEKQGLRPAEHQKDADLTVFISDVGGEWLTVFSDGLDFFEDEPGAEIGVLLSERLSAPVMTVVCFDSDLLLLELFDRSGTVARARVGQYPGVKQRSTPARWKGLVSDISQWKEALRRKYVFAEDSLETLEPLLGLGPGQGSLCPEIAAEETFAVPVKKLYYVLSEQKDVREPPHLSIEINDLMPCEMGRNTYIGAINTGGKSTGLAVAFSGSYVEKEEIRFRDVQLEYGFDRYPRPTIPLTLEKRQMGDGQWVYYAELPAFQLPPGVKGGLPIRKAMDEAHKREFGLRFTPEGDGRKRLDITLHFIPMENPAGECQWYVWQSSGSKLAFIERFNQSWSARPYARVKLLDADEFDLDG